MKRIDVWYEVINPDGGKLEFVLNTYVPGAFRFTKKQAKIHSKLFGKRAIFRQGKQTRNPERSLLNRIFPFHG